MSEKRSALWSQNSLRFFEFMAKRESLRLNKEAGRPWPWSSDNILNTYKFTNVKREHDRTTRWMRANWTTPNKNRPGGEIIFNCALFRYFGTVEFAQAVGWQRRFDPSEVAKLAAERQKRGLRVFTGAYIIPSLGIKRPKYEAVCHVILQSVWENRNRLAAIAMRENRWSSLASSLSELPGFGGTGFMAKEVLQDVMQTPVLRDAKDRNSWCPAGPGARRGLNRIANRKLGHAMKEEAFLDEMIRLFEDARNHLPTFMPELELHDIQFQLCEFDKYERVRLGEGRPKALYKPSMRSLLRN